MEPVFEWFAPDYRFEVPENNMKNLNIKDGFPNVVHTNALEQLGLRAAGADTGHATRGRVAAPRIRPRQRKRRR